ncbi:MAG TPA: DUF1559 domain-containing protein [Thermoguttaceae bacterium]|nr:DUF1559 domain-containing protein [Thermoguttaceae bacterium]
MDDDVSKPFQFSLRKLLLFVAACAVLFGLLRVLWLAVESAREAARTSQCECRMNQIAMAFYNYHDTYGCFPPAYVPDAQGKPMHSWRVLILPYIEQHAVYNAYDFDEPWDGPNNRKLAGKPFSDLFHCPSGPHMGNSPVTDYVVIVGPHTAFPGSTCTSFDDFEDGRENTIILAEIADSDVHWMDPRDLDFHEMSFGVNDKGKPSISGPHPAGPLVVFADGITAYNLSDRLRPETLRALITIDGGEKVVRDEFEQWDDWTGKFLAE